MAQDMSKFIIGVVIVGVTLIVGIYIAATLSTTFDTTLTNSYVNETHNMSSSAGFNLTGGSLTDAVCVISFVTNATDGVIITAGNYTQTNCLIVNATSTFSGVNWNVSYTTAYTNDTTSSIAATDLVTALAGGSAWITIIVVVGFAVIVLGLLSSGLGKAASGVGQGEVAYTY